MDFNNINVSVVGLGISNIPLIHFLLKKGAIITARDKRKETEIKDFEELKSLGVTFKCGEDYLENITDDIIFRSPGIRPDIEQFNEARDRGALITSEMELFFDICPSHIIGITGSDGKTTTTTICSILIKKAFGKVFLGGNIGSPLLPLVEEMNKDDYAVVELSSFQLITMKTSPEISVITNISPNHLNWHTDMAEYEDAKKNIFRSDKCRRVVLNAYNKTTLNYKNEISHNKEIVLFGDSSGVYEKDGFIYYKNDKILKTEDIKLPGHHNIENYMAAIAALHDIVDYDIIRETAKYFGGVEHRLELCGSKNGITYYNSSIDSSPTRTIAALSSFSDKNTVIILGGYDKNIPFSPLAKPLCERVKYAVLTGATGLKIKKELEENEYKGSLPPLEYISDFDSAVQRASDVAEKGDRVILSPACASFDAFPNFEKRGEHYKEIIKKICEE